MEKNIKARLYFDKIMEFVERRVGKNRVNGFEYDYRKIKEAIIAVLDSNNEYLLTDCLLYYIVSESVNEGWDFSGCLISLLNSLTKEDTKLVTVTKYIIAIRFKEPLETYTSYQFLLNDYEKSIYFEYCENLRVMWEDDFFIPSDYNMLKAVFQILTAYTFINNLDKDYLHSIIKPHLENRKNILEELLLHVCKFEYDYNFDNRVYAYDINELSKFIVSKLNDNNIQKVIR